MKNTWVVKGLGALVCLAVLVLAGIQAAALDAVPPTPKIPVSTTYGTTTVVDPYQWLEEAALPEVQRWLDAQNVYAEGVLSRYPNRERLAGRVRELSLTSQQRTRPQLAAGQLFYLRETPPEEQPVLVAQPWPNGRERVLVDPNRTKGATAITEFWPSPSGRYVAYGTAEKGTEDTTIHIVDVKTAQALPEILPRAGGGTTPAALAWDSDEKGFVYARLPLRGTVPKAREQFDIVLYHHRLNKPAFTDKLQFGKGLSPVAEYELSSSAGGKLVAALMHAGDGEPKALFMRAGQEWEPLLRTREGIISGAFVGERFLAVATGGAPKGQILAIESGTFRILVPEGDWAMRSVAPIAGGFLVTEVWGPDWRVRHFDNSGKVVRTLALPETGIGITQIASDVRSSAALIAISGWTEPGRWLRYDATTGDLTTIFSVKPAADYSEVVATKIEAVSKDGTRVPVTVLAKRGTLQDGTAPTILNAYGGYGVTVAPSFLGVNLAWIERGGVWAVANIRGGGEYGEGWHQDGRLTRKQNVFDDFNAAAEALIKAKWTTPAKLGIRGGSNGGLLMGAALTQRPDLYRAVVSSVGIYDMLRVELHPNGEFNITEFGSVKDPEQFKALYAYSPLHRVKDSTAYPAVLMLTGENDPRVDAYQSRKMAARLQQASTSSHPVLVLTRRAAGHGVGASFSQRLGDRAASLIFFSRELGLP